MRSRPCPREDCKNINILVTPCKVEGFDEKHERISQANLLMHQTDTKEAKHDSREKRNGGEFAIEGSLREFVSKVAG